MTRHITISAVWKITELYAYAGRRQAGGFNVTRNTVFTQVRTVAVVVTAAAVGVVIVVSTVTVAMSWVMSTPAHHAPEQINRSHRSHVT